MTTSAANVLVRYEQQFKAEKLKISATHNKECEKASGHN